MSRRPRISSLVLAVLVASAGISINSTAASASAPGVVAEYGFNEGSGTTAQDSSPNLLHGTVNGATWDTAGKFGPALSFDGTNDRVDIADADALDVTTGMTLEAWIRPTALSGWRTVMMKERPTGLSYALYASDGSSRPAVYTYTTSERQATSASTVPLNMWTHVAATYDGSTLSVYVNGALTSLTAVTGGLATSTGALRIGGNAVWGEYFAGLVDEVRVYSRALTSAEIQSDMITPVGSAEPPPPPPPPPGSDVRGRWSAPFDLGLVGVNMIQMYTGKVLVWDSWGAAAASATVWDPITGSKKSVPAPYNIFCSGHAQLADGRILVAGGHGHQSAGFIGSNQAAIFDPATETWTAVPPMSQARWYPGVTTLPDGRVIVTSGSMNAPTDYADIPEIYDPDTNSWSRLTNARLGYPYYPFSYVTSDGSLLIAGSDEYPAPTRKLNVATQQWTTVDSTVIDGGSAAMFAQDKVIKAGSSFRDGLLPSSKTTYVLDLNAPNPQWRQTADMAFPRTFHTLSPLPDGTVIATGGGRDNDVDSSKGVLEAEIWSPATETWTTMAPMAVARLYHSTSMALPDARVVVAGSGGRAGQTNEYSAQFFEPPYLFKGQRPSLTSVPASTVHGGTFTATTNQTISRVTLVRPASVTHTVDMDTRHLELGFTQTGNQLTITAPPNANVAPPGYYMLYALNAAGVPSVASFVRLPKVGADTTAPAAPTGLSASGSLGRADLSWAAATDNVGVTAYDVHRSTTSGFTPSAATKVGETTTATTYADTGLAAGTYYYRVVARDAAGNQSPPSAQASATVPADTTAPTVSVTAPVGGASVSGSVSLAASASDNVGVTSVQFRVDGTDIGAADTTSPYGATWNSAAVANGVHSITAVARDVAGNTTTSVPVSVTVNNTGPPPPAGLAAAWSFDEGSGATAADRSPAGNNGTVNGAAWSNTGKYGGALSFDGVNDTVDVPDSASLDATSALTVEAWVRPAVSSGWRTVLMKERPGGLAYTMYSSNAAGRPELLVNTGSDLYANGTSTLNVGQWTHLAMTYDSTTLRVYVNGTEVSTASRAGTIAASTGALRVGGNSVWGEYFSGLIDDVRVYTAALSAAQIQTDMNTPVTPPGPPDTEPPTAPAGLTATGGLGRVDLSWTASTDNVGVAGYDVHRSTTAGFVPSAATKVGQTTTATSYADTGRSPGTYYYRVVARDAANNSSAPSAEVSGVAAADSSPPTVSVTAPAAGATVSGAVTLTATASDNVGVSSVLFRVDGVDIGSPDTTAPYSVSWNTTTAANGSHTITAVATDAAGNVGTSTPIGVTVSQPPPPPPGNGLVAAWSFDAGTGTQAVDSSPSGNNGTLNGPTWTTAGKVGAALSFDGVNDRVDVPDSTSLDATRLTVEAWVRPSSSTGWRTLLLKERSGGLAYGLYSSNGQGRPEADLYVGGSRFSAAPSALPVGTWSHLAMTYDGTTIRIFVNGVQTSSTAQTGNPAVTANALRIGGNSIWGEYFAGLIDEVRLYNRALSATEIQADMNTPVSGAPAAAPAGAPIAGPVALRTGPTAFPGGAACSAAAVPALRVVGPSAEHSSAHHLTTGCCGGCCGGCCAPPAGGGAPTSQVTGAGLSAACGFDAVGFWSLPFGRPPEEDLAV